MKHESISNIFEQIEPDLLAQERMLEQVHAKISGRKPVLWLAPALACLLAVVIGIAVLPNMLRRTPIAGGPAGGQEIIINEGKGNEGKMADYALYIEDFVPMSIQEINAFYGVSIFPGWVPEDLKLPENPEFGVYRNAGGEIVWAQNALLYYQDNGYRNVDLVVNKGQWPNYDAIAPSKKQTPSTMQGIEVTLSHTSHQSSEGMQFDYYYADFQLGQAYFNVETCNLTQDEFLRVVNSLLANAAIPVPEAETGISATSGAPAAESKSTTEVVFRFAHMPTTSDEPAAESPSMTQVPGTALYPAP